MDSDKAAGWTYTSNDAKTVDLTKLQKELIQFCIQHSDYDGPLDLKSSSIPDRDPKDYEWLKQAMDAIPTDAKRMKELISVIKDDNNSTDRISFALEELQYLVEDIDNSKDFIKLPNAYDSLLTCCQHTEMSIRIWGLWVLATVTAHNPDAHKMANEKGVLPMLMHILDPSSLINLDNNNEIRLYEAVREKALTCLSALIQENPMASIDFLKNRNGMELLTDFLDNSKNLSGIRSKMKALHLISMLLLQVPVLRVETRKLNTPVHVIPFMSHPQLDMREKSLEFFLAFVKDTEKENISYLKTLNLIGKLNEMDKNMKELSKEELERHSKQKELQKKLEKLFV